MLKETEKNIVETVAYYDQLGYPLTSFEIWKYLTNIDEQDKKSVSFKEIIDALEDRELNKYVESYRGFYFLEGRKELVETRINKNKTAIYKMKSLRKIVWFLRLVPFVRMIAVSGRLAMKNTDKGSDWDLFIAIKKGKIWTGRTLITIFLQLIGKRRYGKHVKDRICLNYFVTDESLKIDTENRQFEINLFSANEYSFMVPLFGFKKFRKFQIRNLWIRKFKPNYMPSEIRNQKMISDSHFSKVIRKAGERIFKFDFIENFLSKLEKEKIARNPKTHKTGSIIEANEHELVFLPEPQGKEIYQKCRERLAEMGIN